MADIEIEIDGQVLKAKPNETIIQVADRSGIYIPRFCYHQHLSIPANCRMCLVEVEKMPKVAPACATPVMPGMKVSTKSQKTMLAQRAVMEFLLINHPLDCPICDQGGECELQDLTMGYGSPWSKYQESKRAVPDQNLGPLISTEMTRCIHCTRCVRFGEEVAGISELGLIGRGEFTEISTYVQHAMQSEVSGNIVDLCPVGALTSKPFRFTARAWELEQFDSISPHDCVGANIHVHTRDGVVMRVVPRENNDINQTWISDRDRFAYTGLQHEDRLAKPMVRVDGNWEVVEWEKALEFAANGLQAAIAEFGADKLGALANPSATLEEHYLLQKIIRALGSHHIDHRLREIDYRDQSAMPLFPGLPFSLDELEQSDAIILLGSNIQKEQPLLSLRVRKASLKGAAIIAINPVDYQFNFPVTYKAIVPPQQIVKTLQSIIQQIKKDLGEIAHLLKTKERICLLLGAISMHHPQAANIRHLAQEIMKLTNGRVGILTEGANSAGAWLAGCVPHRHPGGVEINHAGLSAHAMLEKPRKAFILLNVEPELDCTNPTLAIHALKQAAFTVAFSIYKSPVLEMHADVIFPLAPFTETSGTYVNANGLWQHFTGVAKPFAEARPGWKILRVLANFLHLDHFQYQDSQAIIHELKTQLDQAQCKPQQVNLTDSGANFSDAQLVRIGEVPPYAVDSIVRHAQPLQSAQLARDGDVAIARIHPETAARLKLRIDDLVTIKQNDCLAKLPIVLDKRIAQDAIWIAGGIAATDALGDLFGAVEIL